MWSIQNILLLVTGLINLAMSIFIISRGWKNKVNLYFSLLTFFNSLWAASLFFTWRFPDLFASELAYRTAYFAAVGIAVSLFYFSLYFPYKNKIIKYYQHLLILFSSIIIAILSYTKVHILSFSKSSNHLDWQVDYSEPFYIVYSIFFFYIVVLAMVFLYEKTKSLDGFMKSRIKILLLTILVGLSFGSYFNLVLPYFENWKYEFAGPLFTAFMNAYVFYLIKLPKKI